MGLNLKNIGGSILNILGQGADAVIPGDQSFLHPGQPTVQQRIQQIVQPAAQNVLRQAPQAVGNFANNAARSINSSPDNPIGMFATSLYNTHNLNSAAQSANSGFKNLLNDFYVKPVESGISQASAQFGHPLSIPKIAGYGGVKQMPSFTQNVARAKGPVGKGLAVAEDVGNAASLIPGVGLIAKGAIKGVTRLAGAETKLPKIMQPKVQAPKAQSEPVGLKTASPSSSPQVTMKASEGQPFPSPQDKLPPGGSAQAAHDTKVALDKSIIRSGSDGMSPAEVAKIQSAIDDKFRSSNPLKIDIPRIAQGDYTAARNLPGRVANPLKVLSDHAVKGIEALHPADKPRFWKDFVEHPETIATAKNPRKVQEAVTRWRNLADTVHASDSALGGDTAYMPNYARGHNWDLGNDNSLERFLAAGGKDVSPSDFRGINNKTRTFKTINEGEAAGLKVIPGDPAQEAQAFANSAAARLRRQAMIKGLTEADSHNPDKLRSLDLGNGQVLPLSEEGIRQARAFKPSEVSNKAALKTVRSVNVGLKSTILSGGQFHTINIGVLRAAPTLAMKGHPVAAAKAVYGAFRAAFGTKYADRVIGKAIGDGMVEKAAQLGMPYGSAGYHTEGSWLKGGVGHKTVFEKQMPMVHDQVVRSIVHDLEKKGISLDSPDALKAGQVGNQLMGFINKDVLNLSPKARQAMADWMLAGQFTPSKALMVRDAVTKGGVAGSYARRAAVANVAATAAIATGIGWLVRQQSDNIRDILLRALIDPAVPTPFQDGKGNTVKLRMPGTDASDIAKLLGLKLVRQSDGHLGVTWHPDKIAAADGTVAEFFRARLSPLASTAVKIATNTSFAGKPLYDPSASFGTRVGQTAATVGSGFLPIGAQGLAYTDFVKNHVPQSVKDVLDANTPGANPILKSLGSSFGLTPSTDQTVGKGLDSSKYFSALDQAKQGLNSQEAAALQIYTGSKKNPVTGKYEVEPSAFDTPAKANALLQNPTVIDRLAAMNQQLKADGQGVDPLWTKDTDKIKAMLERETITKNDTQALTDWNERNKDWAPALDQERSVFFNSLPPGDPNKPKLPFQPPVQTPEIQDAFKQYDTISDPAERTKFFSAHPELTAYMAAEGEYINKLLVAQGQTPLKPYPAADPTTSSYVSAYMKGDKAQRAALRTGNPDGYQKMQAYLQNVSEYEVAKNGALDQLQGQSPNQKLLKGVNSLATYDMVKNQDGSLALKYGSATPGNTTYGGTGTATQAAANAKSSSKSGSKARTHSARGGRTHIRMRRSFSQVEKVSPGRGSIPRMGSIKAKGVSIKGAPKISMGKPRVTIKKSTV